MWNLPFTRFKKIIFFKPKNSFLFKNSQFHPREIQNVHIFEIAVACTLPYYMRCISVVSIFFLVIFFRRFVILNHFFSLATVCAVVKPSSTTTKTQVVFDGSCKTSNGNSLNDLFFVGPTIQQDLLFIVLRYREHQIVLTGDIKKMYRQVLLDRNQRNFQKIIWKTSLTEEADEYMLNTVTDWHHLLLMW